MTYDFKNLDCDDFEKLVGDILGEKYPQTHIEIFARGRDKGIDLRFKYNSKKYIVQCKHYAESDIYKLCSVLKKDELPKIQDLKPERYLLITSLKLTPPNKDKIISALSNNIKEEDIWGRDEINLYLLKYPAVEKRNYKLWFNSVAVLENVINKKYINRSKISLEKIKKRIEYYVEPDIFNSTYSLLDNNNLLIIKGNPGIGKSMLANALSLRYIREKYEYYELESIDDFFQLYDKNEKQIFFFDDFLGQTEINSNFSSTFCKYLDDIYNYVIGSNNNTKFILTTRNYILNTAKELKADNHMLFDGYSIVELKIQNESVNAIMLAKRLKAENINYENIIKEKRYLNIIWHENFSPRIIDIVLSRYKDEGDIYEKIMEALNNPRDLWKAAVNALDQNHKSLLYLLILYNNGATREQLKEEYSKYNASRANYYKFQISNSINDMLIEMDGAFVNVGEIDKTVKYFNPSFEDYIKNIINCDFNEEDFILLLESSSKDNSVINLIKRTNVKEKFKKWMRLEGKVISIINEALCREFSEIKKVIDILEKFIWSLLSVSDKSFNFIIPNKYTYSNNIKNFIIKIIKKILQEDINYEELVNIFELTKICLEDNMIDITVQIELYDLFCKDIFVKIHNLDEFNDEDYIALYCKVCKMFKLEINKDLNEYIRGRLNKKKDDNIYMLFDIYKKDALKNIQLIGEHFNVDMGNTIIDFEQACEEYREEIENSRSNYRDFQIEDSDAYDNSIENIFENILLDK